MNILFQNPTFAFEFMRVLGESVHGGADIKECLLTASRIEDGSVESWYEAWHTTAERVGVDARAPHTPRERVQRSCDFR